MHIAGFAEACKNVLALHQNYEQIKNTLAGKQSLPAKIATPEQYPSLKPKFTDKLDYEGAVAKSCVHCHNVREAERQLARANGEAGLINCSIPGHRRASWVCRLIRKQRRHSVKCLPIRRLPKPVCKPVIESSNSLVNRLSRSLMCNGFCIILRLKRQCWPRFSEDKNNAWSLCNCKMVGDKPRISPGVRQVGICVAWSLVVWSSRNISKEDRATLKLPADQLALRVKHAGQFGEHAQAKNAGVQKGDIINRWADQQNPWSESDLLTWSLTNLKPGQQYEIEYRRGEQIKKVKLTAK